MTIKKVESHKVCLRIHLSDCWARKLWQYWFDFYKEKGGDTSNLDNVLIDYENIKKCVERDETPKFYIGMLPNSFSTTFLNSFESIKWSCFDHFLGFNIDFYNSSVVLTKYEVVDDF